MKLHPIKTVFTLVIAILVALLAEVIARKIGGQPILVCILTGVTVFLATLPALGITYPNRNRAVSAKVFGGVMALLVVACNIIFALISSFAWEVYIGLTLLLVALEWLVVYLVARK